VPPPPRRTPLVPRVKARGTGLAAAVEALDGAGFAAAARPLQEDLRRAGPAAGPCRLVAFSHALADYQGAPTPPPPPPPRCADRNGTNG